MQREAIRSARQLFDLDEAEMLEGYWDGRANEPEPGHNRSLSYWHGWRNGMMDFGHMPIDGAAMALAADFVAMHKTEGRG